MSVDTHSTTAAEQSWINNSTDPAKAALCVPLAAAFNRLDAGLLEPVLAAGCVYESQSAIEGMRGKMEVLELPRSESSPRCTRPAPPT